MYSTQAERPLRGFEKGISVSEILFESHSVLYYNDETPENLRVHLVLKFYSAKIRPRVKVKKAVILIVILVFIFLKVRIVCMTLFL